jgi:DeoR/GlpR family transcriptional regulator of sugar metabolism
MLSRPHVRVIAVGGELSQENQAVIGQSAAQFVVNLRLSVMMLSVASIDARGVYVRSELELGVKQALIEAADHIVLLCDVSKEGAAGTVRVCGIDAIDTVVTDASFSDRLTARIREIGARIIVA